VSAPRIQLLPGGVVSSLGDTAAELVRHAGRELDEWQRAVLHGGLGVKADESWAADEVAVVAPGRTARRCLLRHA
jgi:hypothetical protein